MYNEDQKIKKTRTQLFENDLSKNLEKGGEDPHLLNRSRRRKKTTNEKIATKKTKKNTTIAEQISKPNKQA